LSSAISGGRNRWPCLRISSNRRFRMVPDPLLNRLSLAPPRSPA
jgi:hypothetical protein